MTSKVILDSMAPRARFYVGLVPGETQTSVAVIERAELVQPERDPLTWSFRSEMRFHVRHTQSVPSGCRLVDLVKDLVKRQTPSRNVTVVVNSTEADASLVDLLRRNWLGCLVIPVRVTAADMESHDGECYRVPAGDLTTCLHAALQKRRLQMPARLQAAEVTRAVELAWWRAARETFV